MIHITITVGFDAVDDSKNDETVNIAAEIIKALRVRWRTLEVIDETDDLLILEAMDDG